MAIERSDSLGDDGAQFAALLWDWGDGAEKTKKAWGKVAKGCNLCNENIVVCVLDHLAVRCAAFLVRHAEAVGDEEVGSDINGGAGVKNSDVGTAM